MGKQIDLSIFRNILLEKKSKILKELRQKYDAEGNAHTDIGDMAADLTDREILMGINETESRILDAIETALDKIENGTYGKCVSCGKFIGEKRLLALPFAQLCVDCKKNEERSQKKEMPRVFIPLTREVEEDSDEAD
ncbi:MAG: TraR/DksA family transcriptional regulator [bacterium]